MKVAVVGAGGYAGGELLRIVLQHPDVTECVATSRSRAGHPFSDAHPGLAGISDARFAGLTPAEAARGQDVVFLCLEHGESSRIAASVFEAGPGLVVDLAADFRIHDGRLHAQYYGPHPAAELVHRFRYALADVEGDALRGATALAAPGCFATTAQLALRPLAGFALAAPPSLFAVTGSSGAGAKPRDTTHHPMRAHNMFAYGVMGHRHEGEVLEQWRRWTGHADAGARLMVHSGPFVRGIHLTMHASLAEPEAEAVCAAYTTTYQDRPFMRVIAEPPQLTQAVGTNLAVLHAAPSPDGREVQVMVVLDNLIKGAGGQGVQGMNLALGLAETRGLRLAAPYPL